ncbi:MAG: hypothetical protein J6Y12_00415 [Lachnospiraceae bacterium]|nr:hypothetical protein [Lachnospiraceae bacterium]
MKDFGTNRQFKDRLFVFLFGNEEYKENTLSLYNAVVGSNYKNVDDIVFYTIRDVIYIKMKNDVAVLFDSRLSLWEHQATYNPNMPLRGLMYFGKLYDKYIQTGNKNIFGKTLIKIPTPRYYVFYNGTEDYPAVMDLKLSDAFETGEKTGDFEWTATVYNLNSGKNQELLDRCRVLDEYMEFVESVRKHLELGTDSDAAIDNAVTECIENGILADYLLAHRSEVIDMVLTEFNEEVFRKGMREEGFQEGYEKGIEEGINTLVINMLKRGKSAEEIAEFSGLSIEDVMKAKERM